MTIQEEINNVKSLQEQYESAIDTRDSNAIFYTKPLFHKWYSHASILFDKFFDDEDVNYKAFISFDASANAYVLKSNYYGIQANANVLLDKIQRKQTENKMNIDNSNIFIVHGHDEVMKEAVARCLSKFELSPIILNEQSNQGQTIIEKLEANSNVGFAVILLSPCDVGRSCKEKKLKPRARQNVIAEMGFFIGKLGRERVCILQKYEVEPPSDFSGITYYEFDVNDAWQMKLAKELKAAGYYIDMNKI